MPYNKNVNNLNQVRFLIAFLCSDIPGSFLKLVKIYSNIIKMKNECQLIEYLFYLLAYQKKPDNNLSTIKQSIIEGRQHFHNGKLEISVGLTNYQMIALRVFLK